MQYHPQWKKWMEKRSGGNGSYSYPEQTVRYRSKEVKVQVEVTCMGGRGARIESADGQRWAEIYKNAHEPNKPTYGLRLHRFFPENAPPRRGEEAAWIGNEAWAGKDLGWRKARAMAIYYCATGKLPKGDRF